MIGCDTKGFFGTVFLRKLGYHEFTSFRYLILVCRE